jgi:hypothetical protein
MQRTKDA